MNFCTSAVKIYGTMAPSSIPKFLTCIIHRISDRLYVFYVERHHDSHLNKYLIFQIYLLVAQKWLIFKEKRTRKTCGKVGEIRSRLHLVESKFWMMNQRSLEIGSRG